MPRFYIADSLDVGNTLLLPDTVFRHAIQVLRLNLNELLILFNGQGGEYQARITELSKRQASVIIEEYIPTNPESTLKLSLVQALIKPDKMDFALQKAVELGITTFQPLITRRSVVQVGKEKIARKLEHWQAIALGACEQSGRTSIPMILEPISLETYLAQTTGAARIILAPELEQTLADLPLHKPQALDVVIGPEGGFTSEEVKACLDRGVHGVTIGPRILRAETASISALSLMQHRFGDL
ncbi:16S rRNA (uracil(1498)-N(3))-methyltransferase [Thiolinea disciformis]|uniref:16S rRNA (uracil(1498)-N(3))-methyltransferase n=1 Tax=Thiolinea disciformis TaxID=125614 RepID=UPI0003726DF9|nr:16S rRNA (uracil(1498)-N(3))-methyltransferase [Thiolinea disciformis]